MIENPRQRRQRIEAFQEYGSQPLFDVLIYDTETRKVLSIEGRRLQRHTSGGNYSRSADSLVERTMDRLTKAFHRSQFVGVFPAGQFSQGDTIPTEP